MKLLVSVRSVEEALLAAQGGADFIDLKEPLHGALGGLPVATIQAIVRALRGLPGAGSGLRISATVGDLAMAELPAIRAQVHAVGGCGVDYVKVGIERKPGASAVLQWLAGCGWPVIPVFIADAGLDDELLRLACSLPFAGLMADTADKKAGSLFDAVPRAVLQHFVSRARASGHMVGLAGALRLAHAADLAALAPDYAGFRSAVCEGERSGTLSAQRLHALVSAMRQPQATLSA